MLLQAEYSPLYCEGIGLSDGEVMERMWSYLRRYTRMTKEMCPAHRIDILSHALLYYGRSTKQKLRKQFYVMKVMRVINTVIVVILANLLVMRWNRASEMNSLTKNKFSSFNNSLKGYCVLGCRTMYTFF